LIPAHGIYWLIMLHALGFPDEQMPQLLVHGWWNLGGAKMSKTAGNVIDPNALVDKYGAEALRYYLMSDIATGKDADFSDERLVERYNADLANSLGNLLNRTLNMAQQYQTGILKRPSSPDLRELAESAVEWDKALAVYSNAFEGVDFEEAHLGSFDIHTAIDVPIGVAAVHCNQFIEEHKPWSLAKNSVQAAKLSAVLYALVESLRIIAILISPVLPLAAHGIFDQLKWKTELSGKGERFSLKDAEWGKLPDGHVVGKPVPLFPRIEIA